MNVMLIAVRFDGVVSNETCAILLASDEVDIPPDHKGGGPVRVSDPLKSISPALLAGLWAPIWFGYVQSMAAGLQKETVES